MRRKPSPPYSPSYTSASRAHKYGNLHNRQRRIFQNTSLPSLLVPLRQKSFQNTPSHPPPLIPLRGRRDEQKSSPEKARKTQFSGLVGVAFQIHSFPLLPKESFEKGVSGKNEEGGFGMGVCCNFLELGFGCEKCVMKGTGGVENGFNVGEKREKV